MIRLTLARAAVAALALLYAATLVWNCRRVGITIDEPGRLLGAHLYWKNLPDKEPKDQPPLLAIVTGWAPLLLDVPLLRDDPIWDRAWKDHIASYILDRLTGEEIDRLFFLARLGVIVFPLLTAWLIWRWAREIFSGATALLVVSLFFLLPSARGHGALVTSDMMASFTYLLCAWLAWRFWLRPSWGQAAALGAAAALAVTAKLSLLIAPVLCAAALLAACWRRRAPLLQTAGRLGLYVTVCWLVLVAAYKFDTRRLTEHDIAELEASGNFPGPALLAAPIFQVIPTPADLQQGVRALGSYHKDGMATFLFGEVRQHGHWAYFPACFVLKTPIGFQILALGGIGLLVWNLAHGRRPAAGAFLLLAGVIYFGVAMASSIQIGVRLILPALVCLVLVAGWAIETLAARNWGRVALAGCFAFIVVSTARIFPHDISYFNEFAGGPERGWRHLSDSNIDWGHNLPDLARYMQRSGLQSINWFFFSYDKTHRYFPEGQCKPMPSPWTPELIRGPVWEPEPGWYAVHASLLWGQFYPEPYRDYLRYFREARPVARPGYGIFVYQVKE